MTDSLLVEAVRNREDGALGAVYDAHASAVYQYCWFLLADDDAARAVVRDVFIVVEGRIDDLADPAALRPWLFAIARDECRRRMATGVGTLRDLPPDDNEDPAAAEPRAIAIAALAGLDDAEVDALVLRARHRLAPSEIALVTGVRPEDVPELLNRGGEHLRDALTAEILTRKGPSDCPRRAEILDGWGGRMTTALREHLVRHASVCEQCEPGRPRSVAPAKAFEPLPWPPLPMTLRVRVMSSVTDPALRGYRNFVLYRAGVFGRDGFPRSVRTRRPVVRRRKRARAYASLVALLLAVAGTVVAVHALGGPHRAAGTIRSWADGVLPRTGSAPSPDISGDTSGGRTPVAYHGPGAPAAPNAPADARRGGRAAPTPHGQPPRRAVRPPARGHHAPPRDESAPPTSGTLPPPDGGPTTGPTTSQPTQPSDPPPSSSSPSPSPTDTPTTSPSGGGSASAAPAP